jgi:predicted transposase YbfD/YdcC
MKGENGDKTTRRWNVTMQENELNGLMDAFNDLPDPRSERNQDHPLMSILFIAICAAISGANNWVEIEAYGKAKQTWLETLIALPHGIPSHDTFGRVFRWMNPQAFQERFLGWVRQVRSVTTGAVVAMDGKQMRGSKDGSCGKDGLYMVSAWAVEQGIVLGQRKVDEKSNEITALPELLEVLDLEGCIVTIDAMGCQTDIAEKIVKQGANYMLAVKGNQDTLSEDIHDLFAGFEHDHWQAVLHDYSKTVNKDHGRLEIRECWVVSQPEYLTYLRRYLDWKDLHSLVKVVSQRRLNGKTTIKTRYFISSLTPTAQQALAACRDHWQIENDLHWVLDVAFAQDHNRVHKDHAPENLAVLQHIALNLLKQERSTRSSVKTRRLRAGWDDTYLWKILRL